MRRRGWLLLAVWLAAAAWAADLEKLKSEPNLEKRSRLALEFAESRLKDAHEAYSAGKMEAFEGALRDVQAGVELAYASLKATNKNPSRSPKHFKNAEIKTRRLARELDALSQDVSVVDRPLVEPVLKSVRRVDEDLLLGIMGKTK